MLKPIHKNILFVLIPTIAVCFFIAELFFRYVIPACEIPDVYFEHDNLMIRFDTRTKIKGTFTMGKFAQQQGEWRINNYGWNSDVNYVPYQVRSKPLIAIIGDSYIESFQVDVDKNIAAVLRKLVGEEYEVYSFGTSGAPLSQYLHLSRYVNQYFRPDITVFNMVYNDFGENLREKYNKPHYLQMSKIVGQYVETQINPYKPNRLKQFAKKSALIRYIWLNLRVSTRLTKIKRDIEIKIYNANTDVLKAISNKEEIIDVTSHLVEIIKKENLEKEVFFLMDAPSQDIYHGTIDSSNVKWMNDMLLDACIRNDCHYTDLTMPFLGKYRTDSLRFNSIYDRHWNELGHKTAAITLYNSLVKEGLLYK